MPHRIKHTHIYTPSAHTPHFPRLIRTELVVLFLPPLIGQPPPMHKERGLTGVSDDVLNSANIALADFNASIIWSASYTTPTSISAGSRRGEGRRDIRVRVSFARIGPLRPYQTHQHHSQTRNGDIRKRIVEESDLFHPGLLLAWLAGRDIPEHIRRRASCMTHRSGSGW